MRLLFRHLLTRNWPRPLRGLRVVLSELGLALLNRDHIPWARRIACWRRGFFANKAFLYDFDRHGWAPYVTDRERHIKTDRIQAGYGYVLGDKLVASFVLRALGAATPQVFLTPPGGLVPRLPALAREHGRIVVKPRDGSGGAGFHVVAAEGDHLLIDGRPCEDPGLLSFGSKAIATEFVVQHPWPEAVFPDAVNTIRLLTLWDRDRDEAFLAAAVHRFGTRVSAPVDNWAAGGVACPIDPETGVLGPGVERRKDGRLLRYERHPDSNARLTGATVPRWQEVRSEVLRVARALPFLECVGWDVILTRDGPSILEGNNRPGLDLFQVHRPLLVDDRVRSFYARWGIRRD